MDAKPVMVTGSPGVVPTGVLVSMRAVPAQLVQRILAQVLGLLLYMTKTPDRAVLNVTNHIIKSKYILTLMNFSNTVNILQNGIENYRASTMVIGHRGLKKFAFNLCLLNVFSVV